MTRHDIHGYAIVSEDGMIADASGTMPAPLKNDADWAYFQQQLDLAQLVLVGRRSHEAAPTTGRRRRLVMSRSGPGLEQRGPQLWWWNPTSVTLDQALAALLPDGGRVAVPGGQAVFDLLGQSGAFDQFHLSCVHGLRLPGGHPAFSSQTAVSGPEVVLRQWGLLPDPSTVIDPVGPVTLALWRRHDKRVI